MGQMVTETIEIVNRRGLHARASAKFVQLADQFQAKITVAKDGSEVCGTSIMGLMMLAAAPGQSIVVTAEGPDARVAMDALKRLIANKFDED